jgi:predicted metal-dependent peptidase
VTDHKTGKTTEYTASNGGAPEKDAQEDLNKEVLRQATAEALKEARPSMGTEPGGLASVIEKLIAPPRIAWNNRFRQLIGKNARYSMHGSWKRFSRRLGEGFRGRIKDHGLFITVVADTSGSVADYELSEFDNEMRHIRKLRKVKRLHVVECDAAVHRTYDLPENGKMEVQFAGRGGTDFRPAFEYVKQQKLKPDMLVFFTDSQGSFPEQKPEYPVIWCVTTKQALGHIPWGDVVVMDVDKPRGAAK